MVKEGQAINSVVYVSEDADDLLYPNVITEVDSVVSRAKAKYDIAVVDPGVTEGSVGVNHLALAIGIPTVIFVGIAVGVGVAFAKKKRKLEVSLRPVDDHDRQEVKQHAGKQG